MVLLQFHKIITLFLCVADGKSFDKWIDRLSVHAPDGFTVTDGLGGWRGKTGFVTEPIKLFTVWGPSPASLQGLLSTLDELRVEEQQEAVSVQVNGLPFICFDTDDILSVLSHAVVQAGEEQPVLVDAE